MHHGPTSEVFIGSEAVAAGRVTRHELRRWYTTVYRGVYAQKGAELSFRERAIAAWLATGRKGVIAGVAASALLGASWVDPKYPVELIGVKCRPQPGLVPRTDSVAEDEITRASGLPVTTRVRTAFDMGRHLERTDALARLDALMWNQAFSAEDVEKLGQRYPRAGGLRRLRKYSRSSTEEPPPRARAGSDCGCWMPAFRARRRRYRC